jgi:CBS domain-containing protein
VDDATLPVAKKELLAVARDRAPDDPLSVSVRRLIAYWGSAARGYRVVAKIRSELKAAGLTTQPDFAKGHIDSHVLFVPLGAPTGEPSEADEAEVGLLVRSLQASTQGVTSVTPQASIGEARALMMLNDYSQLAVLSGPRSLRGAVSWESIAKSSASRDQIQLRDAIVPATLVRLSDALLPRLPTIAEVGYVFVQEPDNTLAGIITAADITLEFGSLAGPYFLLGEIERRLRRILDRHFSLDDFVGARAPQGETREVAAVDDLSLGEVARVLQPEGHWNRLGWHLERSTFLKTLDRIREVRNDLMHFSPDLPTHDDMRIMNRTGTDGGSDP